MSEERKITYLDRLKITKDYLKYIDLDNPNYDRDTINYLKTSIEEKIKIASGEVVKEKLSEELIQKIENKLINSYVKIQWPNSNDLTYTKLSYVKLFGNEYRLWIEYDYDFYINVDKESKTSRFSYAFFNDEDVKINTPTPHFREEFTYSDDIENKIYQMFKIIDKDEIERELNQIVNTLKSNI